LGNIGFGLKVCGIMILSMFGFIIGSIIGPLLGAAFIALKLTNKVNVPSSSSEVKDIDTI
jgi:hypothetical protein